jgi:alanine racemase
MGRLGIWHEDAPSLIRKISDCKHLSIEGVYTHFANADHPEKARTQEQLKHFQYLLKVLKELKVSPKYVHAANSMGLARFRSAHLNLVRPGILLYGINPSGGSLPLKLKPVMALKTRVALIKEVEKGRAISYGSTYKAPARTRIAVLPIGYSHGYKVGFSNKAQVVIRGRRYPVVGRVTMDQTLVNLGPKSTVRRWDEVFILGPQVSAAELATHINTIPYEIVCSVHSRIPRF